VEADAPGKVMEDGAHRGGLSLMRWRMEGGAAGFRSGVGAPLAAVPPVSFCGRREQQRGELRAEMEGREKERVGAAVTGSRGGGAFWPNPGEAAQLQSLRVVGSVAEGGRR
jgi:hypothetical protein